MADALKSPTETALIDKVIYVAAIVYPLTTIPQIIDIIANRSSVNVSLWTWIMYDLFTFVFLWYAISKKLKPLIIEYSMWIAMQSAVVLLVVIYR